MVGRGLEYIGMYVRLYIVLGADSIGGRLAHTARLGKNSLNFFLPFLTLGIDPS